MAQEQPKKQRYPAHRTQWTAQFAVASELCKRGYQVALTMGNHPVVDLMVSSPNGTQFLVDVKGQHRRNFWPVREKKKTDNLFYVLAFVPEHAANRFFILTQEQANDGIKLDSDDAIARRRAKGLSGPPGDFPGIWWEFAEQFEGAWSSLPG